MEKDEKGFLFLYTWTEPFSKLPAEDFKRVFLAVLEYQRDGTPPPEMDGVADIVLDFITAAIDYRKETTLKNRENAKKRWGGNTTAMPPQCDRNATALPKIRKEKIIKDNNNPPIIPPCGRIERDYIGERFDEFWKAYPKKVGKEAARKAFVKLHPTAELFKVILDGIEKSKKSQQWQEEHGRFIPDPSKWLNQGRWDDELTEAQQPKSRTPTSPERGDWDATEALNRAMAKAKNMFEETEG